jgi:DNA (cytosine-5)-methyltransferase 1
VRDRFEKILREVPRGVRMNEEHRDRFGLLKHRIFPMAEGDPAPTMTTLPDDVLHYRDPRILTVRETARIQSFPDWFSFKGKYTTGGDRRTKECPRYTQVGNAVPPLLALAIGRALAATLGEAQAALEESSRQRRLREMAAA